MASCACTLPLNHWDNRPISFSVLGNQILLVIGSCNNFSRLSFLPPLSRTWKSCAWKFLGVSLGIDAEKIGKLVGGDRISLPVG